MSTAGIDLTEHSSPEPLVGARFAEVPPAPAERTTALVAFLVLVVYVACQKLTGRLADAAGLSNPERLLVSGLIPPAIAIALTLGVEKRLAGRSWREAARRVGLWALNGRQLAVGALATVPIWLSFVAAVALLHVGLQWEQPLGLVVLKYAVQAGIAEEVLFRGFLFRQLRRRQSFLRAATISGLVFATVHLLNLMNGVNLANLAQVAISIAFGFAVTYAAAFLFERGGNSLWGFAIVHTAIDSLNFVKDPSGTLMALELAGSVTAMALVFPLARALRLGPGPGLQNPADSLLDSQLN